MHETQKIKFIELLEQRLVNNTCNEYLSALIVIKLEDIRKLNTTLDYVIGHQLYMMVGEWIQKSFNNIGQIYSLEDDKYVILLEKIMNENHVILAANKLLNIDSKTFQIEKYNVSSHVILGITVFQKNSKDATKCLQDAEIALNIAEENNAQYEIFSNDKSNKYTLAFDIRSKLEHALDNNELYVVYQPKMHAKTKLPVGAEALLRWNNPVFGHVSPELFIPYIEKSPLMNTISDFVLNTALREQREWSSINPDVSVSVNFSPIIMQQPQIEEIIKRAMAIWGNKPEKFIVEITETMFMESGNENIETLKKIMNNGIEISIDDFGTGYSSLSYFKNIPANEIKIDKSFIKNLIHDKADYKIVRSMINLAQDFDHRVVAEGVESIETWDILKELGCDVIQGYVVSKPLTIEQFTKFLRGHHCYSINKIATN